MKRFHLFLLVLFIVLIAIGSIFAIHFIGGFNEPKEDPKPQSQEVQPESDDPQVENAQDENDPEPESNDEPERPETPEQEDTNNHQDETEQSDNSLEEDEIDSRPNSEDSNQSSSGSVNAPIGLQGGKLNPNPKTKAEIEKVLNDPYMMLVNRDRRLDSDFKPANLVDFKGYQLNQTCAGALRKLMNAGKDAGYTYTMYSGYRTYSTQYNKYYNKIDYYKNQGYSEEKAIQLTDQYYAPPGGSEHHTGLAADVCISSIVNKYACLHENYDATEEFEWFSENAHKFGFILRYPKGKESITGYNYEPWHYRYVGVDVATWIYNNNLTFEEYIETLEARLDALS